LFFQQAFFQSFWLQKLGKVIDRITLFLCGALLLGCSNIDITHPNYQDDEICKTKEDFRKLAQEPCHPFLPQAPPFIPLKCPEVLPKFCHHPVSLSLSGKIPLGQAFFELARQVGINISVSTDPEKMVELIYQVQNKPFIEVLENLCALGKMRYYFAKNTLHICDDKPYLKTHNIQFLLGVRKTKTHTSVKTDVFADGLKTQNSSQENGASFKFTSDNTVDFWQELEKNLQNMLMQNKNDHANATPRFSINRYAGVLSVFATDKEQRWIEKYLKRLQLLVCTQVLIEAKIIEVDLTDEYKSGINWSAFFSKQGIKQNPLPFSPVVQAEQVEGKNSNIGITVKELAQNSFTFYLNSNYLGAMASFMETFGTVRTLANPRLTVLNNQSAILKVARNEVFFELKIEDILISKMNPMVQRAESRIQTVPIGLIMYVHPSINFDTGEILLSLHPMISKVIAHKADPSVALSMQKNLHDVRSEIPIVQVREMDSVIVAKEGQIIVTGGLMEENVVNQKKEVPYISKIPLLGEMFKFEEKKKHLTELVIILKISIVRNNSTVTAADQRIYQDFSQDPRPFSDSEKESRSE
jgi:MSHA type pilus biogenesis protein MshL